MGGTHGNKVDITRTPKWVQPSIYIKNIDLQFFKQILKTHFAGDDSVQVINFYPFLFHAVAVTDGYSVVLRSLMIYRNTKRCSNGILAAVTFANGVFFVV